MPRSKTNCSSPSDPRIQVTRTIWGYAVGMFALCVPLSARTGAAAVIPPVAVAVGAGAGTVAVWRSKSRSTQRLESDQSVRSVRSLEERIANLETIASHGELEMQHPFKQPELQQRNE